MLQKAHGNDGYVSPAGDQNDREKLRMQNGDMKAREEMANAHISQVWAFQRGSWRGARDGASAGAFYDTPHGVANAVLLPYVMEHNQDATGENTAKSPGRWALRMWIT